MFEDRKAKKNEDAAIRIFTELFVELNELNPYGVTEFTPVYGVMPVRAVNDDINYHMYKMAEECGVFLLIKTEYADEAKDDTYKYILSLEPIFNDDNIISLGAYKKTRNNSK